jgi:hypothetical protein
MATLRSLSRAIYRRSTPHEGQVLSVFIQFVRLYEDYVRGSTKAYHDRDSVILNSST